MKILATATLFLIGINVASADDFVKRFEVLKEAGDDDAIVEFLQQAAVDEAGNPDYYAKAGNYWWGAGGAVAITPIEEGEYELDPKDFSIIDSKTGKKVGSIGKARKVDPALPKKALNLLSEGAKKFPARADIALGLAHVQKEMGLRDGYVETLTALLAQAEKEPRSLAWTLGGELPEPAETLLPETLQTYSSALFNANSPATDKLCVRLLDAVIKTYPDHPFAYNLKGALADATGRPEEALQMLQMAHKRAPEDALILANLARAHENLGQAKEAIAAFEKTLQLGTDPRSRAKVEAELKKLKQAGDAAPSKPARE